MSGQRDAANLPDSMPALSDPRVGGVLSDLERLEMRRVRGGMGASTLAAPRQSLSSIQFRDPLTPEHPDRPADPMPRQGPAPIFIEQEVES